MEKVDSFLLSKIYTPISQWAGRNWGSTACSLSRFCIAPMLVFDEISIITNPHLGSWLAVFPLILATIFWFGAPLADQTPNFFSYQPCWLRVIWLYFPVMALILFSPDLPRISRLFGEIACVSVVYFRAVPAPPPKKKREPKAVATPAYEMT